MPTKVLVIGAGIAGLSTASYLQRNGFDTEILELHDKPGGLCTAWNRKGYTFDGCIHWLMGSGPSSNLHEIWRELGAGGLEYVEWDEYTRLELSGGERFTVYTDPDRLEEEMLRLGPLDGAAIRKFCNMIRRVRAADLPAAFDKLSWGRRLALVPSLPGLLSVLAAARRPMSRVVAGFKSSRLREAFGLLCGKYLDEFPQAAMAMMLGFMAKRSAGYPAGGSLAFARALEAKYLSLGGRVSYGSRVEEVLVEDSRARGVSGRRSDGSRFELRGDYVISAADGFATSRQLLGGRYRNRGLDAAIEGGIERYPSLLFVGLGLRGDWSGTPHSQTFNLEEPLALEDGALVAERLTLRLFNFDRSLSPEGCTAATVMLETSNDEYWTSLRSGDPALYAAKKREAADAIVSALDRKIPGFAAAVEVIDVSTPATFVRYTGNWHGSYEGWLPTISTMGLKVPSTFEGLSGFWLVGQWTAPGGGLPPCGMQGRKLARKLCRLEGRRFTPD